MPYDFFSGQHGQLQGPQIDIPLFGDAASKGIAAGNALPTPLTAAIQGGLKGYAEGQDFAIKQNQIDQQPVQNALAQQQLERAKLENQVLSLNTQVATSNQDLYLANKKEELQIQKQTNDQKLNDFKIKDQIAQDLNDPLAQQGILDNPAYSEFLTRNPKEGEYVIGSLASKGLLTHDQQLSALERINLSKALQLQQDEKKQGLAEIQSLLKEKENATDSIRDDGVLGTGLPGFDAKDAGRVQVFPKGVKPVDPKTGLINKEVPDQAFNLANKGQYDLFVDGKLSALSPAINDTKATNIGKWKDSTARYQRRLADLYGIPQSDVPGAQVQKSTTSTPQPVDNAAPKIQTFDDIAQQTSAKVGADVAPILQDARQAGSERGTYGRIVDAITGVSPVGVSREPSAGEIARGEVPDAGLKADELIKTTAASQAQADLQRFNDGDQETKNTYRDWAKQNGLSLKYSDIKNFYESTARSALNQGYQESYQLGTKEADQKTQTKNAVDAANSLQDLKGLSVDQAVKVRQKAAQIGTSLGLPPAQTKQLADKAGNVQSNGYLANKPAYVKGVAMTESGGNPNALSPTGVKGLMQVTQTVASAYGLDRNVPEENVLAGQFYLDDLIRQFDGSKELAYAAYNAGPAAVSYAQKLADGATDWNTVRKFMLPALRRFPLPKGVTPEAKYAEVYNYPNKVRFNESLFT